jgi:SAM-dependent methyltransferase
MIAKNSMQQRVWASGDLSMVGLGVTLVGELLCESIPVHAGDYVLDVATGSGNTALAAARRGCRVTGVDFVPALLERAQERASAERVKIDFREADAEALPFEDGSFNVVLSTFGAMFASPALAAGEMLRVCRPGGKIGMANWAPTGFFGQFFKLSESYAPLPAGSEPPFDWGVPEITRARFGKAVSDVRFIRRQVIMRHFTPESWVEFFKTHFGPTLLAHEAAGERAPEFTAAMVELARRYNQSGDETLFVPADYLEVIATRAL